MVLARREGKKEKEGMKKVAAFGQITTGDTLLTFFWFFFHPTVPETAGQSLTALFDSVRLFVSVPLHGGTNWGGSSAQLTGWLAASDDQMCTSARLASFLAVADSFFSNERLGRVRTTRVTIPVTSAVIFVCLLCLSVCFSFSS